MPASLVQSKAAAQNTGLATVTVSWDTAATAGNLLLIVVGSDDYRTAGGLPSGFTQSTGCAQQTFLGHYLWWKVASGGETSAQYTIGSASPSCWLTAEVSGVQASPYDTSNGQFAQSSGSTYTTPAITPTAGERFIVGSIGGSGVITFSGVDTWLNSFTEITDTFTTLGSGTRDCVGASSLSVTANGSTSYSTGATFSGAATPTARTGIAIAFKVAAAAGAASAPPLPRQRRFQHLITR